jgi:opacity protein-like surface antigen
MISKNKIITSVACATLLVSTIAIANEESTLSNQYGYVQINGGPAYGITGGGFFGNKNTGTTGVYGLEAGYKFDDYTRASLSLDYMPNTSFNVSGSENTSGNIGIVPYTVSSNNNFKVNSWVAMFNAYYDIKNNTNFTPYITLGVGIARNKAKSTYTTSTKYNGENIPTSTNLGESTKDNFAYKLGIGSRYALTKTIDFDLRYQFVDMGKFTTVAGTQTFNGITDPIAAQTVKLKTQEILVGLAYKF